MQLNVRSTFRTALAVTCSAAMASTVAGSAAAQEGVTSAGDGALMLIEPPQAEVPTLPPIQPLRLDGAADRLVLGPEPSEIADRAVAQVEALLDKADETQLFVHLSSIRHRLELDVASLIAALERAIEEAGRNLPTPQQLVQRAEELLERLQGVEAHIDRAEIVGMLETLLHLAAYLEHKAREAVEGAPTPDELQAYVGDLAGHVRGISDGWTTGIQMEAEVLLAEAYALAEALQGAVAEPGGGIGTPVAPHQLADQALVIAEFIVDGQTDPDAPVQERQEALDVAIAALVSAVGDQARTASENVAVAPLEGEEEATQTSSFDPIELTGAVADAIGDRYAGASIDVLGDRSLLTVRVKGQQADDMSRLEDAVGPEAAHVRLQPVRFSLADLDAFQERLLRLIPEGTPEGDRLLLAGPRIAENRVELWFSEAVPQFEAMASAAVPADGFHIRLRSGVFRSHDSYESYPPYKAGKRVRDKKLSSCTSGFAYVNVNSSRGTQYGSMAAHCTYWSGDVHTGHDNRFRLGYSFGDSYFGNSSTEGDTALVYPYMQEYSSPLLYVDQKLSRRVISYAPRNKMPHHLQLCMRGKQSGIRCGHLEGTGMVRSSTEYDPVLGRTRTIRIHNQACASLETRPGDSGGPVYAIPVTREGVDYGFAVALGGVSGGYYDDRGDDPATFSCFDPVYNVLYQWGIELALRTLSQSGGYYPPRIDLYTTDSHTFRPCIRQPVGEKIVYVCRHLSFSKIYPGDSQIKEVVGPLRSGDTAGALPRLSGYVLLRSDRRVFEGCGRDEGRWRCSAEATQINARVLHRSNNGWYRAALGKWLDSTGNAVGCALGVYQHDPQQIGESCFVPAP